MFGEPRAPTTTAGECEAHCALGHTWRTTYRGSWTRARAREGKRAGWEHAYILECQRCPACGHSHSGFKPTKFIEIV